MQWTLRSSVVIRSEPLCQEALAKDYKDYSTVIKISKQTHTLTEKRKQTSPTKHRWGLI